jgi:hypothetical protein
MTSCNPNYLPITLLPNLLGIKFLRYELWKTHTNHSNLLKLITEFKVSGYNINIQKSLCVAIYT